MIRITFEMLPKGDAEKARTIGIMEVANIGCRADGTADYAVVMKKTPPFNGALELAWKKGRVNASGGVIDGVVVDEDEEMISALVTGHHRTRRGVYDLLFRSMVALGLDKRNPT